MKTGCQSDASASASLTPPGSNTKVKSKTETEKEDLSTTTPQISPEAARRILISLMVPSMVMPLVSSMSRVALPIIRDDFQIPADITAWVAAVFTLPFMILMPVYGRLSDGLGKRRLILAGLGIFSIGTLITLFTPNLGWLMAGRAIQGIGASGIMPMGMALISSIFKPSERGKALGTWSSIGPTTAFIGPLSAGFLVAAWGWRAAFAPPLLIALVALVVVYKRVPAGLSAVKPNFLRQFDWVGVVLLAATLTGFMFFLSSRPITGVEPLQDWRLLGATILLTVAFLWWTKRRVDPFVSLKIFSNKMFSLASLSAAMRMVIMGGLGFLMPLYLVDVHGIAPAQLGMLLMLNPGSMALMVRFGGLVSDRWGSRWPVAIGLLVQTSVVIIFSQLPGTASIWWVALVLCYHGLGAGLMLAALHHAAMGRVSETQMGGAAGLYSMIRFIGASIGTALGGVILQRYLDASLPTVTAYQNTFLFYAAFGLMGAIIGFSLKDQV